MDFVESTIGPSAVDELAREGYTVTRTSELEELRAMKKRAEDAERWTAGAGEFEKSVGQREGVRYVLYGEVPVQF